MLAACTGAGLGGGGGGCAISAAAAQPVTGEVLGSGSVKVGLLLPLSANGNAGQIAKDLRNAADLAIRDFQTAGIQVLVKDDRGTVDGARAAASAAISQGAELIIGPLFAQSVTAVAQVAKASRVPVVAFSTDTTTASAGVYLLSFLPQGDVDRIIGYAASKGRRSFAALLPDNAYGTIVEAALQRAVANARGRVMSVERYALDKDADADQGDGDRRPGQVRHGRRGVHARRRPGSAVPRPDHGGRRRRFAKDHLSRQRPVGRPGDGARIDPQRRPLPGARQHRLRRLRPALPGGLRLGAEPHGDARLRCGQPRRRADRPLRRPALRAARR